MNLRTITLATIIGLSAPAIADVVLSTYAVAQPKAPIGMFSNDKWSVSIYYQDNVLNYHGKNLTTGDTITLSGAKVEGNSQRRIYIWNNGNHLDNYQYRVAWRPDDPGVIRLQLFHGENEEREELINTLLYRQQGD